MLTNGQEGRLCCNCKNSVSHIGHAADCSVAAAGYPIYCLKYLSPIAGNPLDCEKVGWGCTDWESRDD